MFRTSNICSLSNFQIYYVVLLAIVTVLYITFPGFIYFTAGSLCLWKTFTHPSFYLAL